MDPPRPGLSNTTKFVACVVIVAFDAGLVEGIDLIRPGLGWHYARLWAIVIAPASWVLAYFILKRIYGHERLDREFAFQDHQRTKLPKMLFGYCFPILSVLAIVLAIVIGAPAWSAARGGGTTGTLKLLASDCGKAGDCRWWGAFTSDDRSDSRPDVEMADPLPANVSTGTFVHARDTGSDQYVYAAAGSTAWHDEGWLVAGGGAYLLGFMIWLLHRWAK